MNDVIEHSFNLSNSDILELDISSISNTIERIKEKIINNKYNEKKMENFINYINYLNQNNLFINKNIINAKLKCVIDNKLCILNLLITLIIEIGLENFHILIEKFVNKNI